jgi:prepilin-type N-terminal cleavage/methylation domain-containing protein
MTTCDRQSGFTLLEVIVVLGVLGLLLGTAVPLAGAVVVADRRQEAQNELARIGEALDSYYFEHAAFPTLLTATDFLGVHLQPGVRNTATVDAFGGSLAYVYSIDPVNNLCTCHSRGENGVDDGFNNEELGVTVRGAVPGSRRTWMRLRLVVEALANHIEAGGSVAGSWSAVRASIGLGSSFDTDGFGTALQWTAATHTLTSAGPDRRFGTADDITL